MFRSQPGSRKVKFKLPGNYITDGQTPKKTFDLGTLNLETVFYGEERELIVSRKKKRHLYDYPRAAAADDEAWNVAERRFNLFDFL